MKPLKTPKNDRVIKTVKPPPNPPLTSSLLWDKPNDKSKLKRYTKLENSKRAS